MLVEQELVKHVFLLNLYGTGHEPFGNRIEIVAKLTQTGSNRQNMQSVVNSFVSLI